MAEKELDPLNYDCDVPGCKAKKGEYCDKAMRGFHAMRGHEAGIEIAKRKKREAAERKENRKREATFHPPFELTRSLNMENPEGPIWTWTLRHFAGSPRDYIVLGEFTTEDVLMSNDALEMILNKITSKKEE